MWIFLRCRQTRPHAVIMSSSSWTPPGPTAAPDVKNTSSSPEPLGEYPTYQFGPMGVDPCRNSATSKELPADRAVKLPALRLSPVRVASLPARHVCEPRPNGWSNL